MNDQHPTIEVFTDGGSRGNPGPSACAFVVLEKEVLIHEEAVFLGVGTNNQAEYQGLINALSWLLTNQKQQQAITVYMDSELVVKQVKGIYKVKHPVMKVKHLEVKNLLMQFTSVDFKAVPRRHNAHPDRLLNECLETQS